MRFRLSYIILFLFVTAKVFCQDILIKKDSSKTEVKILEIRQTEISYKPINNPDGPLYVVRKSDIAYITYANGTKEVFNEINSDSFSSYKSITTQKDSAKSKKREELKVGDYIKFNIQAGIVINNSYCNLTRRSPQPSHTSNQDYTGTSDEKYNANLNIGFNFLFGKNHYVKHVIGVNYLRSTGEYNYNYSQGGYTTYVDDFHYVSKIDFINVVTGLRFKIFKRFYIEPLVSINIIAHADVRRSGTSTTKYISGNATVYKTETDYFSNTKVDAERINMTSTVSLCPRVSYEFNIKNQKVGVFVSYNLAYQYRLPWMMAGISYYPFKKLK